MTEPTGRGAIHPAAGARQLSPEDFTFHGFGDLGRDEMRKILRLGIRSGEPAVETIDGAVFVPGSLERGDDRPKFAGGVIGPDGRPIETAQIQRKGGKRFDGIPESGRTEPEQALDTDVVYLGPLFNHYGRVLLETLARVWHLAEVDPSVKVIFTNANSAQLGHASWLPGILTEFGVPQQRIVRAEAPTRLRRAIVPEPLFEQFYAAHVRMIAPFRAVARRVAGNVVPTDQPLYLSRRLLSSRQRPVIGEELLEDVLRESGFRIAYPETMAFVDQVRMINAHRHIVSPIGSAAHTILFALHGPSLHLLASRDDLPANYYLCSALAEAPTTFVNGMSAGGRATPNDERQSRRADALDGATRRGEERGAGPQALPQLIDLEAITGYLRQIGLSKGPPRALAPASDASLRERFTEAWLYANVRKASGKAGVLTEEMEAEATEAASRSWPVSLMLARYYASVRDVSRAQTMATRFIELCAEETDRSRLEYFRGDVEGLAPRIARVCGPAVAERLDEIVAQRWPDIAMNRDPSIAH